MINSIASKFKNIFGENKKPVSYKNVTRFLVVIIFILALTAGYYQAKYNNERKRYLRLEDLYVRVRNELGVDSTQEIIDFSYKENSKTNSSKNK